MFTYISKTRQVHEINELIRYNVVSIFYLIRPIVENNYWFLSIKCFSWQKENQVCKVFSCCWNFYLNSIILPSELGSFWKTRSRVSIYIYMVCWKMLLSCEYGNGGDKWYICIIFLYIFQVINHLCTWLFEKVYNKKIFAIILNWIIRGWKRDLIFLQLIK